MKPTIETRVRPKLNSLDDLLNLNKATRDMPKQNHTGTAEHPANAQENEYAMVPLSVMEDYPGHPFHRYTGQRKADMVESIKEYGILQPLLLRPVENGRYHVMAGHNRRDNALEAGLSEGPAIIKHNLTDAEAWVYVIETNLMQRSFGDMLSSEKAAVIALRHSKLVSQGRRNDILDEIRKLENPYDTQDHSTYVANPHKLPAREALALEYGLAPYNVAKYLRVDKLIGALKERLDNREITLYPAATLSFLTIQEQQTVNKCVSLNGFKVDGKKANILREYSKRDKLNEENIFLILSGELGQPQKCNCTPTIRVTKSEYARFFSPEQSAAEVKAHVIRALEFYHNHAPDQTMQIQRNDLRFNVQDDADMEQ